MPDRYRFSSQPLICRSPRAALRPAVPSEAECSVIHQEEVGHSTVCVKAQNLMLQLSRAPQDRPDEMCHPVLVLREEAQLDEGAVLTIPAPGSQGTCIS